MTVSRLDECGKVKSFRLNDKCAAGTGAFLEKTAGCAPADIMPGAVVSLADRAVQLLKRVGLEPELTLVGGMMHVEPMIHVMRERLRAAVNIPPGDFLQYTGALGAALLAYWRVQKLRREGRVPAGTRESCEQGESL